MPQPYPKVVFRTALQDAIAATESYRIIEEERFAVKDGRRKYNTRGRRFIQRRYKLRMEALEAALVAMRKAVNA